jgi:hypothetical protein
VWTSKLPFLSAVLSALKCVDGYDDDDDAKEDIEAGSHMSQEAASRPPISKARKVTDVNEFRRKFDSDERPCAGAIVAASASTSAIDTRRHELSRGKQPSDTPLGILGSSLHTVLPQGGQVSTPGAVPVEGLGLITESEEIFDLNTTASVAMESIMQTFFTISSSVTRSMAANQPSQQAPVRAHHGDAGGFLTQAFLVTEDPL